MHRIFRDRIGHAAHENLEGVAGEALGPVGREHAAQFDGGDAFAQRVELGDHVLDVATTQDSGVGGTNDSNAKVFERRAGGIGHSPVRVSSGHHPVEGQPVQLGVCKCPRAKPLHRGGHQVGDRVIGQRYVANQVAKCVEMLAMTSAPPAADSFPRPSLTSSDAASTIAALEHSAWALAAVAHLFRSGAISADTVRLTSDEDKAAAQILASIGLLANVEGGYEPAQGMVELMAFVPATIRAEATVSILRQIAATAGILPNADAVGWASYDDETLLAQGRASSLGGRMLATIAVGGLAGLAERFHRGGRFLDVGTGVGELGAAFADALPAATVVGLDVLGRALELASGMIRARNLEGRFEVRLQAVEDLDEIDSYDLAWIPAPFVPRAAFNAGLAKIHAALSPGGWVVVGAGRLDGDELAVSVTRWQTLLAGGTPLTADDAQTILTTTGFVNVAAIPTPVGAPSLYCGQRPIIDGLRNLTNRPSSSQGG
jgi:SAM-dependent methyltransferase